MEDDSSYVVHQFIDKYDDSSYKMSKKKKNATKGCNTGSPTRRKRKPKPADMPRRPLSAYNIFFQERRAMIIGKPVSTESVSGISRPPISLDGSQQGQTTFVRKKRAHRRTHGKISFADLAKQIGAAWNNLSPTEKKKYCDGAAKEKARYQEQLEIYRLKKNNEKEDELSEDGSQSEEIEANVTDNHQCKKQKRKYHSTRSSHAPKIQDSPTGLTIKIVNIKKSSSRLRSRRYRPMHKLPTREYDAMCPLPLNFDASCCHPSEIVNEYEMMKAVSPLLPRCESPPEKVSMPSIQSTSSNVSSDSGNEMADILTFFLKDGDVFKNNLKTTTTRMNENGNQKMEYSETFEI